MSYQPQIIIQNLKFNTADNREIFSNLSATFNYCKTGIVGKNGIGKTTLLRLITRELPAFSGNVKIIGTLVMCPQNFTPFLNFTVAEVLGVKDKLQALENIAHGSTSEKDFTTINEDWLCKERLQQRLDELGLANLDLTRQLNTLSGGEITRLFLAKTFFADADFILLDEPTNNLDLPSKRLLYEAIKNWDKGLLAISHDRELLELMDQIVEINARGLQFYGGNYSFYHAQKTVMQEANMRTLDDARKRVDHATSSVQTEREKSEQRQARGRAKRAHNDQPKSMMDYAKNRSERTQNTLAIRGQRLLDHAIHTLSEAREKLEESDEIKIDLSATQVPAGKIIAELKHVFFSYTARPLIQDLSLTIIGPERLALVGANGCGKTTLIKIILGEIAPQQGAVRLGTKHFRYLDQNVSILEANRSILDNFKRLNPQLPETLARTQLARFLFRNDDALKLIAQLSGGEKLRAALACVLLAAEPPQLLILDEPTNHLDLASIASIESALRCYQGALVVISHDQKFIDDVKINEVITF